KMVQDLRGQGMRGLVLDLRFNPGGLLNSGTRVADLFIDDGLIVSIRRPRKNLDNKTNGHSPGSELGFKMVVLINGVSASASEVVASCLQDHARAVIVGERSFGKGCMQQLYDYDGGRIQVTTASCWRPNGKNLHKLSTSGREDEDWGVTPDKGYTLALSRKEREELDEHLRNAEIIPRRDRPVKEKTAFKDHQLDLAHKGLRDLVKASP